MNLFGEIGNFIIKYQELIQGTAIVLAFVLVIWLIIKLFAYTRKKGELLSQINTTVSEINTAVNHLNEKKTDVIYIDNRTSQRVKEPGVGNELQAMVDEVVSAMGDVEVADPLQPEKELAELAELKEAIEKEVEKIEPSLKYFSRDCAVSKTGKQFTLEELYAQIRE